MTKPNLQRVYRNLLWLGSLLIGIFALWNLHRSRACDLAAVIEPARAGFPHWCWEFWINRYQTLSGTLVAVIAAGLVFRSNRHVRNIDRYRSLTEDIAAIGKLITDVTHINQSLDFLLDCPKFLAELLPLAWNLRGGILQARQQEWRRIANQFFGLQGTANMPELSVEASELILQFGIATTNALEAAQNFLMKTEDCLTTPDPEQLKMLHEIFKEKVAEVHPFRLSMNSALSKAVLKLHEDMRAARKLRDELRVFRH